MDFSARDGSNPNPNPNPNRWDGSSALHPRHGGPSQSLSAQNSPSPSRSPSPQSRKLVLTRIATGLKRGMRQTRLGGSLGSGLGSRRGNAKSRDVNARMLFSSKKFCATIIQSVVRRMLARLRVVGLRGTRFQVS